MTRLIDADALKEALDELFKSGGYDSGLVMNTIDNAPTVKPERSQGDLISRKALKEAINNNGCRHSHYFDIFDVIDDAPTVNFIISPDHVTELQNINKELIKQLEEAERPKGKWVDHSEDYGYAECPFCHELTTCDGNIDELHFCWNCGAKLEKGGTE